MLLLQLHLIYSLPIEHFVNQEKSNNNKDIQSISNNSEEDKKDESYNKSKINIEDISVNDISNPPYKKYKMKSKTNNDNN